MLDVGVEWFASSFRDAIGRRLADNEGLTQLSVLSGPYQLAVIEIERNKQSFVN